MRNNRRSNIHIISLGMLPFIMVLGNSLFIPALPNIHAALNITEFQVSLLITAYSLTAAIFIPFVGSLSDLIGRRRIILLSLTLIIIGGVLTSIAGFGVPQTFSLLILGRIVQGIGAAGTAPLAMAALADVLKGAERSFALSYIETMNAFGKVLSPFLGAILVILSWGYPFYFYTVLCFLLYILLFLIMQKDPVSKTPVHLDTLKAKLFEIRLVLKANGRQLFPLFLLGAILLFQLFGLLFFLADLLEHTYQITGLWKGIGLAFPLILMIISSLRGGKRIEEDQGKLLASVSRQIFYLIPAFIILILSQALWLVIICLAYLGWVAGRSLPQLNVLITSLTSSEQRGSVTSIYHSIRFIGVALGPPLYGFLMNQQLQVLFTLATILLYIGYLSLSVAQYKQMAPSPISGG